ncbi:ribonuclease III domain-containing protein [uncultured Ilyobacter sp.]|uniref:Mini-ribonuclease 3 n=1 Tax=uncultured Ilyobacter sp. TaxID=544433 RepID=UPI0029C6913F|nr:ribonuclease III domain-containing protein [uncultured Ilyobacter sp.]
MVNIDLKDAGGLPLAYLGDAVWELAVREYFVGKGYKINVMNKKVKKLVNAKAQSLIFKSISEELDEEYKAVARRAKNSNIKSFPRSCSIMEYREATAFEALIAAFYIKGETGRIKTILENHISEGEE